MRHVINAMALSGLVALAGCSGLQSGGSRGGHRPISLDRPTPQGLVAYLNDNARRVQTLECRDLSIDCKQGNDTAPGLSGIMVCQKPRNFRLTAKVVSQPAVDVGSNEQEFWYWIKNAEPPYVYHCSYQDLAKGNVSMPFPFQPDMIMAALGMSEYDEHKQYEVKVGTKTVELIEAGTSPQGQPIQKVVVFTRAHVTGDRPQITGYIIRDAQGREVCSAVISQVQTIQETGAVIPRRVKFLWPSQRIEMALKLDGVRVAPIDPQRAEVLFSRKNLSGYESYDLARTVPATPTGRTQLQQVGGTFR